MTLKMQFDDLVRKMDDILLLDDGPEEFIECILSSMKIKEEYEKKMEELHQLKRLHAKKEKQVNCLKSKLKNECSKLEKEKKKADVLKKQRDSLVCIFGECFGGRWKRDFGSQQHKSRRVVAAGVGKQQPVARVSSPQKGSGHLC
ncbi:hypothetical protein CDAR_20781 [Caerostris darwini]|uniref:Uncharacterized protein n=1 Tax=Caerostris darwini TaxID=1538125 RepID=A0AAV4QGG4_9ARAC|nr:hypothetical protein CDAR_20781 [Caerostris darwini]